MRTRRRTALASLPAALLLVAGCTSDESPSATDDDTAAPTAAATESADPQPSAETEAPEGGAVTLDSLSGEATRLTVSEAYVNALSAVGAELSAVGGAQTETAGGSTTFVFPVTGGDVTVEPGGADPLAGTVEHSGGLQLAALGRTATVDGLVLDGDEDRLTAMVAGRRVPLLPLSVSDAQISQADDQVVIEDSAVSFDAETLNALADELGVPVTLPAVDVGSLQVTLTGS